MATRWIAHLLAGMALLASFAAKAEEVAIASPDGRIVAQVKSSVDGGVEYAVSFKGRQVIEWSPLGLVLRWVDQNRADQVQRADFTATVELAGQQRRAIDDSYTMLTGKRRQNRYRANELSIDLKDSETGRTVALDIQAADDGVALRYRLTGSSRTHVWIEREDTSFALGLGGTHWGQAYDLPNAWQPAYEAPYTKGVPIGTPVKAADGPGWGIPALFRDEAGTWILLHESGLGADYHGSHLAAEAPGGTYRIARPLPSDGLGVGSAEPAATLPATLPWRFVVISDRLGGVLESNRVFDLAPPQSVADTSWIKPGKASWSWLSDHDSSRSLPKLKAFVDLAAEMGWDYSLVDANWNLIAPDALEQLASYAGSKGIGLIVWYNSGGRHNAVTEEPRNLMDDRMRRRAEFARLQQIGIKGVKIDFFQSDKQDRIAQYLEILEDAAEFHLLVNFHGCTIPRGWQRTWPHLMTMEAVRGAEHYTFDSEPNFAELSTYQNTVLPFTRNAIGSMDFTPVLFSAQRRARLTSNAHEAALAVVFESALLHFADSAAGYTPANADYRRFLREVPTVWDETRYLAGYPGRDVVVARRSGTRWYVAGLNGEAASKRLHLDLSFLPGNSKATALIDGQDPMQFTSQPVRLDKGRNIVALAPYGGFVWVIELRD